VTNDNLLLVLQFVCSYTVHCLCILFLFIRKAVVSSPLLSAFTKLRKATVSFVMSVRQSASNIWASTGRIFMKFDICFYSKICQ
jgi:hypothetical protein